MDFKIKKGVLKKYKDEKGVREIFIPDTVEIIGEGAFSDCVNLERVLVPGTVQIISEAAFSGCENLKTIILPERTGKIGWYAFRGCRNLSDLTMPSCIKEIGKFAFMGCRRLAAVKVAHNGNVYKFLLKGELNDEKWQRIKKNLDSDDLSEMAV